MQRFLHAQRAVVVLIVVAILVALGIGLWPVKAKVFGDASYSCGSGFVHSTHTWKLDSRISQDARLANDTATGTPSTVCPNKVDNYRDIALLVLAFGVGIGLIAQVLLERPGPRSYQSTIFANRRRGPTIRNPAPRAPIAGPQSDESNVQ